MAVPLLIMQQMRTHGSPFGGGYGDGGYESGPDWGMRIFFSAMLSFFLLIVGFIAYNIHIDNKYDAMPKSVYSRPMGEVKRVHTCYSGKHYYECEVVMSTGYAFRTDITEWPDSILDLGTTLHLEYVTQGDRQIGYWCNTEICTERWRAYRGDSDFNEDYAKGN